MKYKEPKNIKWEDQLPPPTPKQGNQPPPENQVPNQANPCHILG